MEGGALKSKQKTFWFHRKTPYTIYGRENKYKEIFMYLLHIVHPQSTKSQVFFCLQVLLPWKIPFIEMLIWDSILAELLKYAKNDYLAKKILSCFLQACRDLIFATPINTSHLFLILRRQHWLLIRRQNESWVGWIWVCTHWLMLEISNYSHFWLSNLKRQEFFTAVLLHLLTVFERNFPILHALIEIL